MWTADCAQKSSNMLSQKNKQTNTITRIYSFMHACTHGRTVMTPRQRRQTVATDSSRLSMWWASVRNPDTIWALHCWQNSLGTLACTICIYGKHFNNCFSFAVSTANKSVIINLHSVPVECWKGFVKPSISCHLKMTQVVLTAAAGNPMMLLPSCSSMLLILFSEGNRIFGGLSVKGAER